MNIDEKFKRTIEQLTNYNYKGRQCDRRCYIDANNVNAICTALDIASLYEITVSVTSSNNRLYVPFEIRCSAISCIVECDTVDDLVNSIVYLCEYHMPEVVE